MKILFTLICFFSLAPYVNAQIDPVLANQLQTILDNSVTNSGNNGVSAHLIMPNGQTWTGTAGVGKQGVAVSDSMLFHGASTTKLNLAILMLMLAEDSLVDLDLPWNQYVSLNVNFDTTITVRQLLNHTSGIADYLEAPGSGANITADFNYFFTPQHILENMVSGVPDFPAGTDFAYSNSNYVLAGLVAEAVTGNSLHTELRNRIWNPLGMNHTYFGAYDTYAEPTAGVWWNFGSGVTDYSNMPTTSMLSFAYGAGNIVSCPSNLAILLDALMDNQLLNAQSQSEMTTFVPNSFSSWTAGYGLGIHHMGQVNETVLGHDGYYTNLTDMFHSTNCGFTLVTMTNTQTAWFGIFSPMYDIVSDYCTSTHAAQPEKGAEIALYPNPSHGELHIRSLTPVDKIEVRDIMGRVVYESGPQQNNTSLSIKQAGVYIVTLQSGDKKTNEKVLVKD